MNKENTYANSEFQPILFNKDQYQEILKAVSAYTLLKKDAVNPFSTGALAQYIISEGSKFGFEKSKMDDMEWFEKFNDEVFDVLFQYSQHEAWEHLANRLAHRDAKYATDGTKSSLDEQMQSDLFLDILAKRLEIYLDEFSKNGIKNVAVELKTKLKR